MIGSVTYRELHSSDVPHIARIIAEVWYPQAKGDEQRVIFGTVDFANYCVRATFARVAELDGKACGVVLAKAGSPSAEHVSKWQSIGERARARTHELWPDFAAQREAYVQAEHRIDGQLLVESGSDPAFELVLFIVSSAARGHGIGGALVEQAESYLREAGAPSYFLYTDTSCTWRFYEHRGLRRAACRTTPAAERPAMLDEYYVYEGKL